jgi:hypothetical protein
MTKIRKIAGFATWCWLFGSGLILSLLGLLFTWKLALIIFCSWLLSWVAFVVKILIDNKILHCVKETKH